VALGGIDGAGKSTQTRALESLFKEEGYDAVSFHEPSDSPWGRQIHELKQQGTRPLSPAQELELFLLDRRYNVATHIQPALAAHKLVLMDRYYFSTIAYQGALGLDPQHIRRLNEAFAPVPELVFVLLIPPSAALTRIRQSRGVTDDVFERAEYLTRVDAIFRSLQGPHIHCIPADRPSEAITSMLRSRIEAVLHQ
jgi:dTMP kinase